MADSGGHWSTLAEAKKLSQSTLIPGVFETDIKRLNPLDKFPVVQAANTGKSIKFVREDTTTEAAVAQIDIGDQLSWSEDITYTEVEVELQRTYIQRKLNKFVEAIYGNVNNYQARVLLEMEKGLKRSIGDLIIYGDKTYSSGNKQFDGLHAFAAEGSGDLDVDMGEAPLSLHTLRKLIDAMVQGCDELWFPPQLARRMDEAYEEAGLVRLKADTAGSFTMITKGWNDMGKPMLFFAGIPIVITDYLKAEQKDTGLPTPTNARAAYSSDDKQYSIFGIKYGNVLQGEPGITLAYGGTEGAGDFYKLVTFPELETYDAGGMRMVTYAAMLFSTKYVIGRIMDIEDVNVVF